MNRPIAWIIAGCLPNILLAITVHADVLPENVKPSVVTNLELATGLDNGDTQKLELQIQPELDIDVTDNWQLTVRGRFRADAQDKISPRDQSKAELRELLLETSVGETFLAIGKQQIVWGKADGLKVLDVVNPQDYREFILDEFDNSRIPLWSVNAEVPLNDTLLQLIWIPDNTYNKFPKLDSLYTFTSPIIVPTVPSGVSVDLRPPKEPDRFFSDADYGMRLTRFVGGWDVSLNYLYHYNDSPVLFRSITLEPKPTVTVTPRYVRNHLYGGTFSNALGSFVLRGEVGYSTNRYFITNNLNDSDGVVKSNELAYVLGLDWSGIDEMFLSVQLFQSRLLDSEPNPVRDNVDTTITFLARRDFMNDTLVTEILMLHSLNNDDGLVRAKLSYELNDEISVWAGMDVFYGDNKGMFGQFNQNDRLIVGMQWNM